MGDRPSGTVTFLFTDVEGSTRLWDEAPDAMGPALARHDEMVRGAIEDHGGYVFATGGDGFAAAFASVGDGVRAAQLTQAGVEGEPWHEAATIRVRIGLHVGEVEERDGDYFGPTVNRAARIMDAGHGGQILVSTPVVEIAGVGAFASLGHHRLQGFGAPEELWQLGPGEFPALRSRRQGGNLRAAVSSFIGRDTEVAQVTAMLGDQRMVTLVGVGGVGKTRLALEAAGQVADGFADGVWFVDLAPRRDAAGVVEAAASTLGVVPEAGEPLREAVFGHLRERRALLVLDNCEHVIDGVANLCDAILREAAGITVVATSREPVAIAGEQVWPMPSLEQAADLFVARAVEADARFRPSEDEVEVIEKICDRLDGIPLAIELAAARTRTMTVSEIQERLDDRFRLLRGSGRGGVERHQTLQATVQWSHGLLDETDRRLFACLSAFPADFNAAAVHMVCGQLLGLDEWDLQDAVDRLVERSLVVASREGSLTRYRLLETFRQFGEQQLDIDTATTLRRAHLAHFTQVAWDAGVGYADRFDDPDPDPWLVERDNIRGAMHWAIADEDHDACERLSRALEDRTRTDLDFEAEEWAVESASHPDARAMTVAYAANMVGYGARGDFQAALELAPRAIELDPDEPVAWFALGIARLMTEGPSTEAASALGHAAELRTLVTPEALSGRVIAHGMSAAAIGDLDAATAAAHITEVERLLADGLSPRGRALAHGVLARAAIARGDLDQAIALTEHTLDATTDNPRARLRPGSHMMRAEALALKNDADAAPAFLEAIEEAGELGWWGQVWRTLIPLARWWISTGNASAAALVVGCATANSIALAGLDELADALADPSLQPALQRGADMTRTELLEHIIAELNPIAVAGSLGA